METPLLVVSTSPADLRQAHVIDLGGYHVTHAASLASAVRVILQTEPVAALLVTGDPAATDQCAVIRALGDIPLLVAGRSLASDVAAACLDAGADAVFNLPITRLELDAHIQAVLRRIKPDHRAATTRQIRAGDLTIDLDTRAVWLEGREVNLTPTEFNLLAALADFPDSVVTNEELLVRVWGPEYANDVHYVRLYIGYLRSKLEVDPRRPRLIVNQWGVGYRLAIVDDAGSPATTHPPANERQPGRIPIETATGQR